MQHYKRINFSFLLIGGVLVMACRKASSFPDIPMLIALLCALSLSLMLITGENAFRNATTPLHKISIVGKDRTDGSAVALRHEIQNTRKLFYIAGYTIFRVVQKI